MQGPAFFDLIECRMRETRMRFYRRFCEPKLFRLARKLNYNGICERCQKRPRAASREARFRHGYAPQESALHLILHPFYLVGPSQMEPDQVDYFVQQRHRAAKAIMEVHPDGAFMTCTFGTTALMMVCIDSVPCMQDLDMLLEMRPKSAALVDYEQRTALHYSCVNNRNNYTMIESLVSTCPGAVSLVDCNGRTPLHYASMAGPVRVAQQDPDYLGFKEKVFAESKHKISTKQVLDLLIQTDETCLAAVDYMGRTPLHYFCLYLHGTHDPFASINDGVLEVLIRSYPAAAHMSDKEGCTPIQLLTELRQRYCSKADGENGGNYDGERQEQDRVFDLILHFLKQNQSR